MNKKQWNVMIAMLASFNAVAGSMGPVGLEEENTSLCAKVIALSLGPAWYNNEGRVQENIFFPLFSTHTFIPQTTPGVVGSGELFFALARPITNRLSGQLGIDIGYSGNGKEEGYLVISPPVSKTYSYSYRLSNARVGLKGRLIGDWGYWVKPYISGSANVGFNRSWNYTSAYTIFPLGEKPSFGDKTTTAFTYTAGIGVQGNIAPQWQLGVGYEFSDWGRSYLTEPSLTLANGITFNYPAPHATSFFTQSVQVTLSYIV